MELKQVNELLKNLSWIDQKKLKFIKKISNPLMEGGVQVDQGEQEDYYNIYSIIGTPDLYLRIDYSTDSYGDNDSITGVQFCNKVI